ncbi:hypothetical protein CK820_G0053561 [Pan troglodytes]|uniref:Interleukin 1 receptor like 1 n=1 Tax=Pan troglodytes TaxID=9598 RepID=A0A2J8ISG7_PANTR|nr:hypothetical protein CK820_G0053561 [Pan troglodytes]
MGFWILAILTILMYSTAAKFSKQSWGLENEALIVRCPRQGKPSYTVDWYYSQTNKSIPTQERNRVFASGQLLKFLPAEVADSGIYTCIVRSPTFNRTGYANVTIYKKQSDCNVPDYLMYSTVSGSEKNSKIYCPTIDLYNWTAPLEWFKNCQALQGSRYRAHKSFLVIDNVMTEDAGDYTCKFIHNENGANYSVMATRSFTVKDEQGFSLFPVIGAPAHNEIKEVEIDVVTAVETNIRKSRRHIFILTPQITHNKEFAYEQEVALHCALIQNDAKVILIEMEALSELDMLQAEALQDSLRHLMKVQGTIKWREDHIANKRSLNSKFWKHVRYQMPVPSKIPRKASSLTPLAAQKQ